MSDLNDFLGHLHAVCDAFIPPVIDKAFHSAFPCLSLPPYCKPAQNQHIPGCRCNLQSQPQPRAYNPIWANPNPNMAYNSNPSQAYNPDQAYNPNPNPNPKPIPIPTYNPNPNMAYNPNPNMAYNPNAATAKGCPLQRCIHQLQPQPRADRPNMAYNPNPNATYNPMTNCGK